MDLNEIWNFLGSPRNNGEGICPRPLNDAGLTQDDEPDLSDFGGMKIQKWIPCGNNTNNGNPDLGTYVDIVVPCKVCEDITVEDALAVYDFDSKITWNNGSSNNANFVKETKNATAEAINLKYIEILGRPADQPGFLHWYDDILKGDTLEQVFANIQRAYDNSEKAKKIIFKK